MVKFTETVEKRNRQALNRFVDLSALDAVDLNFEFVFHVALGRRLSAGPRPAVKSAFYVTSPDTTHYARLHAMLTDHSPLHVALFTDRAAAAKVARCSARGVVRMSNGFLTKGKFTRSA